MEPVNNLQFLRILPKKMEYYLDFQVEYVRVTLDKFKFKCKQWKGKKVSLKEYLHQFPNKFLLFVSYS